MRQDLLKKGQGQNAYLWDEAKYIGQLDSLRRKKEGFGAFSFANGDHYVG